MSHATRIEIHDARVLAGPFVSTAPGERHADCGGATAGKFCQLVRAHHRDQRRDLHARVPVGMLYCPSEGSADP